MRKITTLIVLALVFMVSKNSEAQMAAAKTITWDIEINVDVKASKGEVWRHIIDNEKLKFYSNGYVSSIKKIDQELVESREILFSNGNKRIETIKQIDYVNKFMVIRINSESLPKGIKNAEIAIFTKEIDDENSNILWVTQIEGRKSSKQKLIDRLKAEFESYAIGFGEIKN